MSQTVSPEPDLLVLGTGECETSSSCTTTLWTAFSTGPSYAAAGCAYVIPGYLTNALYLRLEPTKSWFRQFVLRFVLGFFRVRTRAWLTAARLGETKPGVGAAGFGRSQRERDGKIRQSDDAR